jgi:ElaB/YqjD/DUF883 family membrane-anchored ribosome-binding protein
MEVPQLDADALEKQREALDSMLARMSMGASQHDEYDHGDAVTAVQASETQIQALDAAVQNYQERVRKAKENWSAGVGVGVGVGVVVGVGLGPGQMFPIQISDDVVIINPTSP